MKSNKMKDRNLKTQMMSTDHEISTQISLFSVGRADGGAVSFSLCQSAGPLFRLSYHAQQSEWPTDGGG